MFDFSTEEEIKSFATIQPGLNIPAKLKSVEIDEKGNLLVGFEGTGEDKGVLTQRFWANEFEGDNESIVEGKEKRLKYVVQALVPKEKLAGAKGANTAELYNNIAALLTEAIGAECKLKVIYQYNSDEYVELPIFTEMISSDLRPVGLYTRKTEDKNGLPRDRYKKLEEYGIAPDSNETDETSFSVDQEEEEDLPFGS